MSSRTNLSKEFSTNLLFTANYFFHNVVKHDKNRKNLNMKLKNLLKILMVKKNDLDHYFQYLLEHNIVFIEYNYYFINFNLLKKALPKKKSSIHKNFLIIQSDFEIIVKPEIDMDSLWKLCQFGELINHDIVYKFKITENSIHNALSGQLTEQNITAMLLNGSGLKNLPQNIRFMLSDIKNRLGEIKIDCPYNFIQADKHIQKGLLEDQTVSRCIIKQIAPTISLFTSNTNAWDIYFYLKKIKFYPVILGEKTHKIKGELKITLNSEETEYLLAGFSALKKIGFEHHIKTSLSRINNLVDKIEQISDNHVKKTAFALKTDYLAELNKSIKSYVLNSLKASLKLPQNLVVNKIAANYKGDNPATTKKNIINMINFATQHKLKLVIAYDTVSKKIEQIIIPKYLYDNKVLYFTNKETKEEESIILRKIIFSALL